MMSASQIASPFFFPPLSIEVKKFQYRGCFISRQDPFQDQDDFRLDLNV